ncbi:MAG: Holliday junction resolvase RuvX [Arenicella sp.]
MKEHQVVIGFDFGTKRTGIAVGQTFSKTAQALKSISTVHDLPAQHELKKTIEEWQPNIAIIGKPPTASKGFIKKLNKLARFLQEDFSLESIFIDESLTTEQANFELHSAQVKAHQKQEKRDSIAARLIIETYFETIT